MLRKLRITTLSSVVSAALGGGFFAFAAQDRRLEAGSIDAAASLHASAVDAAQEYSTCKSWQEVVEGENLRYAPSSGCRTPGRRTGPPTRASGSTTACNSTSRAGTRWP